MSRTRWFRDANDRERPPWCERKPSDEHWDSGWYGHDVSRLIERLRDAEPEVTAVVERLRDLIASGPPEPYVEPDWSTMGLTNSARPRPWWKSQDEDIEIRSRMPPLIGYPSLWRYMGGV